MSKFWGWEWSLVHRVSNAWVGLKRNHDNILLNILKNDWWSWLVFSPVKRQIKFGLSKEIAFEGK